MFIQTEATPNPSTMKFLPGRQVLERGTRDYVSKETAALESPLAARLFEIEGVDGVFLGYDFISVSKSTGDWQQLKPAVLGAIMEHYMSGAPVVQDSNSTEDSDEFFDPADAEIVQTIKDLLETRVRPAVASDGGDITFQAYREGVVYLKMRGACAGCPSSTATLRHGIENLLKHFVPEVREVQPA